MIKFILVVREFGKTKPDYSLEFEAPELPRVGEYLSIQRPDKPAPFGEDVIIKAIWWRMSHPETGSMTSEPKVGKMDEVFVEAEIALSPYSSDDWREYHPDAPVMDVDRFSVGEAALMKAAKEVEE